MASSASSYTVAMSAADRVKLTTYRRHASTPNRRWIHAATRNGGEHLLGLRRQGPIGRGVPQLGEHPGVHGTVLADLQLGEVEAERLGLPDEVLQLAVRLLAGTGGRQRVLDEAQVRHEVRRPWIGEIGVPDYGSPASRAAA